MVTCYLRYAIDPFKLLDFDTYARMWIPLVNELAGTHHGYFLPHAGANNIAIALFRFPTLTAYEEYRVKVSHQADCQAAFKFAEESRCIISYERSLS